MLAITGRPVGAARTSHCCDWRIAGRHPLGIHDDSNSGIAAGSQRRIAESYIIGLDVCGVPPNNGEDPGPWSEPSAADQGNGAPVSCLNPTPAGNPAILPAPGRAFDSCSPTTVSERTATVSEVSRARLPLREGMHRWPATKAQPPNGPAWYLLELCFSDPTEDLCARTDSWTARGNGTAEQNPSVREM